MLAYKKITLEHLAIHAAVNEAADLQLFSKEKGLEIKLKYPADLYTPNFFVRLGLGVLTFFIVLAGFGLLALITNLQSLASTLLLIGIACYAVLEFITVQKKHFSSGVDNILMVASIIFITSAIMDNLPGRFYFNVIASFLVVIFSLFLLIRFTDSVMAFIFGLAVQLWLFFLITTNQVFPRQIVPCIMIAGAGLLYVIARKAIKSNWNIYYQLPFKIISVIALISFYGMGNYYVVREVSTHLQLPDLNRAVIAASGWFFWIWTMIIPIMYMVHGFKKRNLTFVRLGFILFALSIFTFRYYHAIWPAEITMILAGSILIVVTYGLITYLRMPRFNFAFEKAGSKNTDVINVEGLVIGEVFGNHNRPDDQPTKFGGGNFGGAGAGSDY